MPFRTAQNLTRRPYEVRRIFEILIEKRTHYEKSQYDPRHDRIEMRGWVKPKGVLMGSINAFCINRGLPYKDWEGFTPEEKLTVKKQWEADMIEELNEVLNLGSDEFESLMDGFPFGSGTTHLEHARQLVEGLT